jgi:hypothetical protein
MKSLFHRLILAVSLMAVGASCATVYDPYGRPHTMVEPGAAILGAAAVGLLAYGLASDGGGHHHGHHHCHY